MKEKDIRPRAIFDEYLALCRQDARIYFGDTERVHIPCPACGLKGTHVFTKAGFAYAECAKCFTLFVSPRPSAEAFLRFYRESKSSRFWASTFYKVTAEARREKLWKPKARMILQKMKEYSAARHAVIDIGGGYGIFAEEMADLTGQPVTVIEPAPHLAEVCRQKGLNVVEKFMEQITLQVLPKTPKAFISFELFEHLHDPELFLKRLKGLMAAGDIFIFTTLSALGIDILTLWDRSKSVSPPHHLNLFNPHSVRILLERAGLETMAVSTPGQLDVDLLCQHASADDRFWQRFGALATEEHKQRWQQLIASTGWSSHMLVISRKN